MPNKAGIPLQLQDISILNSPKEYKAKLLELIATAQTRIYITALYLQDDDAGREILDALYLAKQRAPNLEIRIFVDCHRAQRGLIGEKHHLGNRTLYLALEEQHPQHSIEVFGIPVKTKEVFGVLHLKGMVFDNTVLYTGASINDVYCHQHDKYRIDRYYLFNAKPLADSFVEYLNRVFVASRLAPRLNKGEMPDPAKLKKSIAKLKRHLSKERYWLYNQSADKTSLSVKPFAGFGRRRNPLNRQIRRIVQKAQTELIIFTPYFNLPKVLVRDINKALKRGVKVSVTVGDKTANDFYIADPNQFSTIGIVPYLYEMLLVKFVKGWQKYIDNKQLTINLWKDGANSYHLKGIIADQKRHLITGSNVNPRAWTLDLENGLLLEDPKMELWPQVEQELSQIFKHTQALTHSSQLQRVSDYPAKPQKLLKRLRLTQIDKLLKRLL